MTRAKRDRREVVTRGERALRELELSVTTLADKARISRVWSAMRALDDQQAELAERLENLWNE